MKSSLKLFWWAPARHARMGWWELKANPEVWMRLAVRTRRVGTNFGDELSRDVVEAATGRRVIWSPPKSAELVAVGSVLGLYASFGSGAAIWGSGIRESLTYEEGEKLRARLGPVLAVRGLQTRDALGLSRAQVLGDPGVLATLFATSPEVANKRPLVIPHFRAWASPAGRRLLGQVSNAGWDVAEPTLHPKLIIRHICNASFVLTSSLHGLILGHALGVPTQLVTWQDHGVREPEFKYADYLSSISGSISSVPIQDLLNKSRFSDVLETSEAEAPLLAQKTSVLASNLVRVIEKF